MLDKELCVRVIRFNEFESFEPIDEKTVSFKVADVSVSKSDAFSFEFKFLIQSGSKKGSFVYDTIAFQPYRSTSWKMPKLFKALAVAEGEVNFNNLVGMSFVGDLVRAESKKEEGRVFQNINYFERGSSVLPSTPPADVKPAAGKPLPTPPKPVDKPLPVSKPVEKPLPVSKPVEKPVELVPVPETVKAVAEVVKPQPVVNPDTGEVKAFDPATVIVDGEELPF